MNELLAIRYRHLFQSYAAGHTGSVVWFKRRIAEWNAQNGGNLRPDAALFLLVNLDCLIIRPYFGEIEIEGSRLLPLPSGLSTEKWFDIAREATELILGRLANNEGEISAHDVLQIINVNWEALSSMFFWG
jgi:hypothetical protein